MRSKLTNIPTSLHKNAGHEMSDTEVKLSTINRKPLYFGSPSKPIIGWIHTSNEVMPQDTCVIICPPLGLEYMNSYRSLRYVADYFALAGVPALRFDYHGTGDSSGANLDEDRTKDWLETIKLAQQELKKITLTNKVGLLGFRMGATLGYLTAEEIAYDFMILWAPIEKGSRFIREIKALQKTSAIQEASPTNFLEAGGSVYWKETEKMIGSIDIAKIIPRVSKVLLIPRDDLPVNNKLLASFTENGVLVEQMALAGSSEMLIDAHLTTVPHYSISKIVEWVNMGVGKSTQSSNSPKSHLENKKKLDDTLAKLKTSCTFDVDPSDPERVFDKRFSVSESFFHFGEKQNQFAIRSYPSDGANPNLPIIIISNAGTNHRPGPGRLYVQLARQLAAFGFQVLRIDLTGIGDSDKAEGNFENIEYLDSGANEIIDLMNELSKLHENTKFIVAGLCSGAYFSFHTARKSNENNIVETIMINPLTFYWERGMTADNSPAKNFRAWNWYKQAMFNPESWFKVISGRANYSGLLSTIFSRIKLKLSMIIRNLNPKIGKSPKKMKFKTSNMDLGEDLSLISSKNIRISFFFSRSDPGFDLLTTLGGRKVDKLIRNKHISYQFIEDADHTFSKFKPRSKVIELFVKHLLNKYA